MNSYPDESAAADWSRREFLTTAAAGLAISPLAMAATPDTSGGTQPRAPNILFILTDQERFFRPGELPPGSSCRHTPS